MLTKFRLMKEPPIQVLEKFLKIQDSHILRIMHNALWLPLTSVQPQEGIIRNLMRS